MKCPNCGGPLRPAVVWFEEPLPEMEIGKAISVARQCDVFLSIGTSTVVYPAAGLPALAARSGAQIIVVNPEPTDLDGLATAVIRAPAAVTLPKLLGSG